MPNLRDRDSRRLGARFFEGTVLQLARRLVGTVLISRRPDGDAAGKIIEVEAYRGPRDRAAHSFGGRRTARTEAMYGRAGTIYMFRLYGMHWAFNIVAGAIDEPHAILVRALEPIDLGDDLALMAQRRYGTAKTTPAKRRELCRGPGKLCQALALGSSDYGQDLASGSVELWPGECGRVGTSARINIDYAGADRHRPWRFYERGNRLVSVQPRD